MYNALFKQTFSKLPVMSNSAVCMNNNVFSLQTTWQWLMSSVFISTFNWPSCPELLQAMLSKKVLITATKLCFATMSSTALVSLYRMYTYPNIGRYGFSSITVQCLSSISPKLFVTKTLLEGWPTFIFVGSNRQFLKRSRAWFHKLMLISTALHTHTHMHPFNGPFSGTTRVSR